MPRSPSTSTSHFRAAACAFARTAACPAPARRRTLVDSNAFSYWRQAIYAGLGAAAAVGSAAGGSPTQPCGPRRRSLARRSSPAAAPASWPSPSTMAPTPPGPRACSTSWPPTMCSATFFLVGPFAQAEPALVRRIAAAGHLDRQPLLEPSQPRAHRIRPRRGRTAPHQRHACQQITGMPVRFFRPPFGARRPMVLRSPRELGMIPVTWNAMTNDWSEPSADRIAAQLDRED